MTARKLGAETAFVEDQQSGPAWRGLVPSLLALVAGIGLCVAGPTFLLREVGKTIPPKRANDDRLRSECLTLRQAHQADDHELRRMDEGAPWKPEEPPPFIRSIDPNQVSIERDHVLLVWYGEVMTSHALVVVDPGVNGQAILNEAGYFKRVQRLSPWLWAGSD